MTATGTDPTRRPDLDSLFSVNPDGSHNTLHPAPVRGRFQRLKSVVWAVLIGIYVVLPWLKVDGRAAILIDIPSRHFYLFGRTYTSQDFWLAFFFVTGIGFALVVLSALFGRVWCGYGCPQTVFLEGVYRRVEAFFEGSPRKRVQLDRSRWTAEKIRRRGAKYAVYALISLGLSHTLLGYFMPIEEVSRAVLGPPGEHWVAFVFVMALTAALFVNFTWFREQLCIVVCPYGRLQAVLYDSHTINVGYDRGRGEPRGKLREGTAGDCVDCYRCVAVCPTGIDIRNGTQLECVGCANCIDACDEVMVSLGRPPGLVRYDSEAGFEGQPRRFARPRLWLYSALLLVGAAVFAVAAGGRTLFEATLLRLQTSPYTIEGDVITNAFSLHLENKQPTAETFALEVREREGIEVVVPLAAVRLEPLADRRVPIFVRIPRQDFRPGARIELTVRSSAEERHLSATLLGPLGR